MTENKSVEGTAQVGADESSRRLWFDYLSKINDREQQADRATGITNWVLIAAIVIVLKNAGPMIIELAGFADGISAAAIVFVLEIDTLSCFASALGILFAYCVEGSETRVAPESGRRSGSVINGILVLLFGSLLTVHLVLFNTVPAPEDVKYLLFGFGIVWGLLLAGGLWGTTRRIIQEQKHGVRLPRLIGFVPDSPVSAFLPGVMGILPVIALRIFLLDPNIQKIGWLLPLRVSSHLIAALCMLLWLGGRVLHSLAKGTFKQLEREIVLNQLTPSEIKSKYVAQIIGPSVSDLLDDIMEELSKSKTAIVILMESMKRGLTEIDSIPENYKSERTGRAKKLFDQVRNEINEVKRRLSASRARFKEINTPIVTNSANPILISAITAVNSQLENHNRDMESLMEFGDRLSLIANQPKERGGTETQKAVDSPRPSPPEDPEKEGE